MAFPSVYKKVMGEILSGRCSPELQAIAEEDPGIAVDAESALFTCSACGKWTVDADRSLYRLKDGAECGEKTGPDTRMDFVTGEELKENYVLRAPFVHTCPSCGRPMHRRKTVTMRTKLACPSCGTKNLPEPGRAVLWD